MKVLIFAAVAAFAPAALAASPAAVTVHIRDFTFSPATLTVAPGTTVRFVNEDSEAHTVTAVDRSFDSGGLDTGDSWSYRFASPGKFAYFCALHPYMRGAVTVTAQPAHASSAR
jgi:plastocyanin